MVRLLDDYSLTCYETELHLEREEWSWLKSVAYAIAVEREMSGEKES